MSYQGTTRYPTPAMGSYVSPFLPNYLSCPATAGGNACGWPVFSGPGLQKVSPSDILLHRGGVVVLPSPRVESNNKVRLGLNPNCCAVANNPGTGGTQFPIANTKSLTPCSTTGANAYVNRKTPTVSHLPNPNNINERLLNQVGAPSAFSLSSMKDTTYLTPTIFSSTNQRAPCKKGWGGKPTPGQVKSKVERVPGNDTVSVETANWTPVKGENCDCEPLVPPTPRVDFVKPIDTVPSTSSSEQYQPSVVSNVNAFTAITSKEEC